MAAGLSADFSEALPDRISKPISRAARRRSLLRWLPVIAFAVLAMVTGIYFFDSGRFYRAFLNNFPSIAGMMTFATETQRPVNLNAVDSPSPTFFSTASPTTQVTASLGPTLTKTLIPTRTITPLPTRLGGSRQIAYVSESTGRPQIFIINSDGTGKRQVTDLPDGACQPDWSPDGLRLGFFSPFKENINYYPTSSLFIITLDGTGLLPLPKLTGGDFDPDWSPDGDKIAFASTRNTGRPQIFITDVNGQAFQMISEEYAYETQPSWSPDGQQILYILTRGNEQQIWIMDPVGVNRRQISNNLEHLYFKPSFSPDGESILSTQRLRPGSIPILALSPFGDGEYLEYRIGQDDPMPMQEGLISPDGLWIVFEGWTGDTGHDIYVMTVTGLARTRITTDPAIDFDPAWSPSSN